MLTSGQGANFLPTFFKRGILDKGKKLFPNLYCFLKSAFVQQFRKQGRLSRHMHAQNSFLLKFGWFCCNFFGWDVVSSGLFARNKLLIWGGAWGVPLIPPCLCVITPLPWSTLCWLLYSLPSRTPVSMFLCLISIIFYVCQTKLKF